MAISYLEAIRQGFPTVMATSTYDPYVYENIEWTGGDAIPSQDELDAWIKSNVSTSTGSSGSTVVDPYKLTVYEFRQLFTLAERVAIDNFATNDTIPANYKPIIVSVLKDLELSGAVFLNNPDVASGVQLLQQVGLIATGRADQILAGQKPE